MRIFAKLASQASSICSYERSMYIYVLCLFTSIVPMAGHIVSSSHPQWTHCLDS